MSKQRRKKNASASSRSAPPPSGETRVADAVTIAWMMSTLAALLGGGLATVSYVALLFFVRPADITPEMVSVPSMLFLISAVTGVICLLLTPLALKLRRSPPPLAITVIAILAGLLPLAALVALAAAY